MLRLELRLLADFNSIHLTEIGTKQLHLKIVISYISHGWRRVLSVYERIEQKSWKQYYNLKEGMTQHLTVGVNFYCKNSEWILHILTCCYPKKTKSISNYQQERFTILNYYSMSTQIFSKQHCMIKTFISLIHH